MALTPSELRRRKMNLLMAMSYAAFASTKASAETPATSVQIEILTRDASTILTRSGATIIARTS